MVLGINSIVGAFSLTNVTEVTMPEPDLLSVTFKSITWAAGIAGIGCCGGTALGLLELAAVGDSGADEGVFSEKLELGPIWLLESAAVAGWLEFIWFWLRLKSADVVKVDWGARLAA